MSNNLTYEEYANLRVMLAKGTPTQVHRRLSKRNYRGITTIRQIDKSLNWQDYIATYWKQSKPRPMFKKVPKAWYYSPYNPPFPREIQMARRKSLWEKVKNIFR